MNLVDWLLLHWDLVFAIVLTFFSVGSGIVGMAKPNLWDQKDGPSNFRSYLKGGIGAWLYFLICISTLICMYHLGLLIDWATGQDGSSTQEVLGENWDAPWNIWHGLCSIMFTLFHFFIIRFRELRLKRSDKDDLIQNFW